MISIYWFMFKWCSYSLKKRHSTAIFDCRRLDVSCSPAPISSVSELHRIVQIDSPKGDDVSLRFKLKLCVTNSCVKYPSNQNPSISMDRQRTFKIFKIWIEHDYFLWIMFFVSLANLIFIPATKINETPKSILRFQHFLDGNTWFITQHPKNARFHPIEVFLYPSTSIEWLYPHCLPVSSNMVSWKIFQWVFLAIFFFVNEKISHCHMCYVITGGYISLENGYKPFQTDE